MHQLDSFQSVIDLWPSRKAMADDLDVKLHRIHHWHHRNRIPADFDLRLLSAASKRNIPLHWRQLMGLRDPDSVQYGNDQYHKQVGKSITNAPEAS